MREILFRGKRLDNGEWVEGDLTQDRDLETADIQGWDYYTDGGGLQREPFMYQVDPATVGQYTGLADKHGRKIFEGDIGRTDDGQLGEIKFILEHCAFLGYTKIPPAYHYLESDGRMKAMEVIGNIHDNPELLEATPCTE